MPRRKNKGRGGRSQAQREKRRGGNVIQAWRMLDDDISSRLSGTMLELEKDGAIPELRDVWRAHRVAIIDPRLVNKDMRQGFEMSLDFVREMNRIHRNSQELFPRPQAKLGQVVIKGSRNKRFIALQLESEKIRQEREAAYRALGGAGLKGFQNDAQNSRRCSNIDIILAKTKAPMMPDYKIYNDELDPSRYSISQEQVIEAVTDTLTIHGLYDETVEFGDLDMPESRHG